MESSGCKSRAAKASTQADSECCHSPGDWWVRSVHSKEAGREDSAPKTRFVAMPTPLTRRKAASGRPISRGRAGVAGVPSSGHASKGIPHEPSRAHHLRSQERKRGRQGIAPCSDSCRRRSFPSQSSVRRGFISEWLGLNAEASVYFSLLAGNLGRRKVRTRLRPPPSTMRRAPLPVATRIPPRPIVEGRMVPQPVARFTSTLTLRRYRARQMAKISNPVVF
jgi:hypothetical protein